MKQLSIFICTWNVGSGDPISETDFIKLLGLKEDNSKDFYAVGLQEISTGATETAKSFVSYDNWAKALLEVLTKYGYYMVESVRLQGMSLSLFARLSHLPFVRFVKTSYERTGFGGRWGNKGGVAISSWIYGEKFCLVNTHLAAHLDNVESRVEDFHQVIKDIDFDGTANVLSHDACFWFGDTNFRIDDTPRSEVIPLVEKKSYTKLLDRDQLKKLQKTDDVLAQFKESEINFPPTYKYDFGTSTFDTSEKQRKPAWTDRILLRIHPDYLHSSALTTTGEGRGADYIVQVKDSYTSHPYLESSDHKPVTAVYNIKTSKDHEQLVKIESLGKWENDSHGMVAVTYSFGMHKDSNDYLALYEWPVKDFRSYETWMYVPESEDPDKITETKICQYEFPKASDSDPSKSYCIGYYSSRMTCLMAVSDAFKIRDAPKSD